MKRWLVAALLGLGVLLFLAPGIIGLLAERTLERELGATRSRAADDAVRQLDFRRGWFTSAGRHRIPLADPQLGRWLALLVPGADTPPPALIIDTRLEHGLIPLGEMPSGASALLPALATGISTLSVETTSGELRPVPGKLYSRIGLAGSATLHYEIPAGSGENDELTASWQAGSVTFRSSVDGRELAVAADLRGINLASGSQRVEFGEARVDGSSEATAFGFPTGVVRLQVRNGSLLADASRQRWDLVDVDLRSAVSEGEVDANWQIAVHGLETADGPYDFEVAGKAEGVDADLLGPIVRALQYGDADLSTGEPYSGFDADVRRLLSAGMTFDFDELSLQTPSGSGEARVSLLLPKRDDIASWPGLLLALVASADVAIDRSRVTTPSPLSEQLRMLIAGGFLVLDGDVYRLRASLEDGKALVNGAPLVLPANLFR